MAAVATRPPSVLPSVDHDRLAQLEAVVDRGLQAFVEVGVALATIRDERLFAATHPSFKAYLAERWGFTAPFAYGRIYAAEVALAIDAPLPPGISADALRPLVPLLNREGPEAVARAWTVVQARHGRRRRAPSRTEVRAVLVELRLPTCAPEPERMPELGQVGISLERASARVAKVRARLDGKLLPPPARERLVGWATMARLLAAELEALADGTKVAARLAAAEGEVGEVFCDRHNQVVEDGVCAWCRVPDLPKSYERG